MVQPGDVPNLRKDRRQTHRITGLSVCPGAYQSEYGFGVTLGPGEGVISRAYACQSPTSAAGVFSASVGTYRQSYDLPRSHYRLLPGISAGSQSVAWRTRNVGGAGVVTVYLWFERGDFDGFLLVSSNGLKFSTLEHTLQRLGKRMDKRMAAGSPA